MRTTSLFATTLILCCCYTAAAANENEFARSFRATKGVVSELVVEKLADERKAQEYLTAFSEIFENLFPYCDQGFEEQRHHKSLADCLRDKTVTPHAVSQALLLES